MKQLLRAFVRRIVNVTRAVACETYGDTASLSPGPCERCVGRALADLPQEVPSTIPSVEAA